MALASTDDSTAPLVHVEGGRLRLVDCRLEQRGRSPALALRRGSALTLERCEVQAAAQAVAVELAGACQVRAADSHLIVREPDGAALLLWCPEWDATASAEVTLTRCDATAGRVIACRAVGGEVRIAANNNKLAFRRALASFDGYRRADDWRRVLRYGGRDNRHDPAGGAWVRVEGKPINVWSEPTWLALWPVAPASPDRFEPRSGVSSLRPTARP